VYQDILSGTDEVQDRSRTKLKKRGEGGSLQGASWDGAEIKKSKYYFFFSGGAGAGNWWYGMRQVRGRLIIRRGKERMAGKVKSSEDRVNVRRAIEKSRAGRKGNEEKDPSKTPLTSTGYGVGH